MAIKSKTIPLNENSLEVLLEDFAKQNKKTSTNVKQEPVTLSKMRAQALTVKMYGGEYKGQELDESIKYDLRMFFPKFSEEQIEDVIIKLHSIYNESIGYIKKTIEEKTEFEKSLEALLKDFAIHNKLANTAPETEINYPMSLKDRAILGTEQLTEQYLVALRQMRAQVLILSVKLWSVSGNKERKAEEIKHHLRMYFPKLSEEQIEDGLIKLYSIHNESVIQLLKNK